MCKRRSVDGTGCFHFAGQFFEVPGTGEEGGGNICARDRSGGLENALRHAVGCECSCVRTEVYTSLEFVCVYVRGFSFLQLRFCLNSAFCLRVIKVKRVRT